MAQTINVMFLAAEADPFVKVGGLGDVAGALPRALRSLPADVTGDVRLDLRLVLPLHSAVRADTLRPLIMYSIPRGNTEVQVEVFETVLDGMPVYFISGDPVRASGSVYSLRSESDAEKYVFFSLAAVELPRQIGWNVDLLHANDWHTALALYSNLTKRWEEGTRRVASLITLHNLPFMGPDVAPLLAEYGLPLAQTDLPEWARVKPLPLGLWASDMIVPVSPTYAAEILGPEFGCGLQDFLASRRETVHGITALGGVDLWIEEGETLAVIGPNGSGKTSLFNCVTGLYRPTSGSITLQGESLLGLSPDRVTARGVARTFQNLRLFLHMTVLDNLMLGRHLHFRKNLLAAGLRLRGEEVRHRQKCEEIIEFLNLEPWRDARAGSCAYGVQKRVELGRALATEPKLLLLDEPVSGLTAEEKDEVSYWIHEVRGRFGVTVLLVEHDLRVASRLASRMVVLDHGEKLTEGPPAEVARDERVITAYLGDRYRGRA